MVPSTDFNLKSAALSPTLYPVIGLVKLIKTNAITAKNLGWDYVSITDKFLDVTDKFSRRKSIAFINSFPHMFINNDIEYDV
jgi:hypothetical protein